MALFAALVASSGAGGLEWDGARGTIRAMSLEHGESPRYEGSPEEAAQRFLAENRALFNGAGTLSMLEDRSGRRDFGDNLETRVSRVDLGPTMQFVRFQQEVEGIEVDGSDVVVAVRVDGAVTSVQGGYAADGHRRGLRGFTHSVSMPEAEAREIAFAAVEAEELGKYLKSKLVYWVRGDGDLVKSFRVDLSTQRPRGDWSVYVDAESGDVLELRDQLVYSREPGQGQVYLSNPLRDPDLAPVAIERLDGDGTRLTGSAVHVFNEKHGEFLAEDGDFVLEADDPHFAEVMAYFHIDRVHQNLKAIDPEFTGMDQPIPMTVHSKGNVFKKSDNAFYSPFEKAMFILDPIKFNDLHLEAAVSYHEYHHAVTDAIVPNLRQGPEGKALHEGYSDYFACALTADPEIGEWALKKVHRPYMRNLLSTKKYPEDLDPKREPHKDGEIWAAACWDLRQVIPAEDSDLLVHKSRFYITANATFRSAYEGILQADEDFTDGAYAGAIRQVFGDRGLNSDTVKVQTEFEDPNPLSRFRALHGDD